MTELEQPRTYPTVLVRRGANGWGAGLTLRRTATRNKVLSVTGGGIHPVAARIAELTGAQAVDGFGTTVPDEEILCAVINCGGTARIGVYPRKRIPTIDVYPGAPGGPLAQFITEDLLVSDVGLDEIVLYEGDDAEIPPEPVTDTSGTAGTAAASAPAPEAARPDGGGGGRFAAISTGFTRFSSGIGYAVNTLLSSGRQAITLTINTILPFMAYVSLLLGFVIYTGVATLTTVLFVGWITLFGGLTQTFASFYARHWSGVLLHLAGGILGIIVGLMLIFHPALGALALTLLMAVYFLVSGAVPPRVSAELARRVPSRSRRATRAAIAPRAQFTGVSVGSSRCSSATGARGAGVRALGAAVSATRGPYFSGCTRAAICWAGFSRNWSTGFG